MRPLEGPPGIKKARSVNDVNDKTGLGFNFNFNVMLYLPGYKNNITLGISIVNAYFAIFSAK